MTFFDRIKETTTTTGTGDITLAGAASGFVAFSDVYDVGEIKIPYVIALGTEWEVGIGTLSGGTTLQRTTVKASSNAGSAVNFSAGTKDVFSCVPGFWVTDLITRGESLAVYGGNAMP